MYIIFCIFIFIIVIIIIIIIGPKFPKGNSQRIMKVLKIQHVSSFSFSFRVSEPTSALVKPLVSQVWADLRFMVSMFFDGFLSASVVWMGSRCGVYCCSPSQAITHYHLTITSNRSGRPSVLLASPRRYCFAQGPELSRTCSLCKFHTGSQSFSRLCRTPTRHQQRCRLLRVVVDIKWFYICVWPSEPSAPGHLSKPDRRGEKPGGEGSQPGAAGPRRKHCAARGLSARTNGMCQRDDAKCFPQQTGTGPRDPELERWLKKALNHSWHRLLFWCLSLYADKQGASQMTSFIHYVFLGV